MMSIRSKAPDLGLLLLRVAGGLLMAGHGLGKLTDLLAGRGASFPDPLALGPHTTLVLAVIAELFCALAVAAGIATRWAALPVAATMLVAFFVHHAGEPFGDRELALVYAVTFLCLVVAGGGRYSLDRIFSSRR